MEVGAPLEVKYERDRLLYTVYGYWDPIEIAKIISVVERINSPYLLQYRNWRYQQPDYVDTNFFSRKQPKGILTFESDLIPFTLEQFLQNEPNHTLNGDKAMSVISQVWMALNSIRNFSDYIKVYSLHPSNIAMSVIPGTNPKTYQIQLMNYIPLIFIQTFSTEQKMFISPSQLKLLAKDKRGTDCKADLFTFALLITKIWTGKLPYSPNVTLKSLIENCVEQYIDTSLFKNPLVKTLVEMILLKNVNWDYTYEDKYLKLARKATFLEFRSKPEDFEIIEDIGQGTSAIVYQAIQKTKRGERVVAIKEMTINDGEREYIQNEVDIMALCQHPNVIQMYDSFIHSKSFRGLQQGSYAEIIIEFCDGGTLQSFFEKNYPIEPFPDYLMTHTLSEILKGLWYLHSEHHIVHRDLKPENILLKVNPNNPHVPFIKIADFGLSKIVENHQMMQSYVGTPVFMAPEVFKRIQYNYKCDLWSLGGLLYFLRTHTYPLSANRQRFMENMQHDVVPIYEYNVWKTIPGIKRIVENLIVYNQRKRYSWQAIHNDPYVKQILEEDNVVRDYSKL
ncbi:protein kinase domain containing protein [Entamoeba nuttalli P19]|uniref:Protein kinase domain containing protein n=1 Tax=Entamoeba nuttalli (strain P19) TaxID=1076696 RepID=K2HMF6_ENTNP|nr:protein kinase domain containing protein [Entamoeba nuttalli P19]EKE36990.1 protein kinase domain containing protein [Entamoeba nuttalli P19]|eukprot:XP_008860669.1 protein kinase domain containing protein [Entamoeba nuttalli P19]